MRPRETEAERPRDNMQYLKVTFTWPLEMLAMSLPPYSLDAGS